MNPCSASELASLLGSHLHAGDPAARIHAGVTTDTRNLTAGSVFFGLRGENHDGDTHAPAALAAGAAAVVVSRWDGPPPTAGQAVILVPDTLAALQRLAHAWRSRLSLPVVCITGSNGKTSTKDFTTAILSRQRKVTATRGNLNNHIGLPLSVLAARPEHQAAVWEIGMNHAGELAPLCEIARPDFGIITSIGTAHIEFLGSREAIAEEKSTLARFLPEHGWLFLPAHCDFFDYLRKRTRAHLVAVGNGRGVVRAENTRPLEDGTRFTLAIDGETPVDLFLPVPGRHMLSNALLAAAAGWKLGIPPQEIAAGLENSTLTAGRLRRFIRDGITVIDDTYNANPESMAAAIHTLADSPAKPDARRFVVLGRMGELGTHGPQAHLETGRLAHRRGLLVVAVGPGAEGIAEGAGGAPHFPNLEDAATWLRATLRPGDAVLFKGSRSATVERVLHATFP